MAHRSLTVQLTAHANPYAERVIGTIRRECLDHVIVLNQTHLRRTLARYISYYHKSRTHLSLAKDAPTPRLVQSPESDKAGLKLVQSDGGQSGPLGNDRSRET